MVLNNLTKFHKILIKNIRLRERKSFQMVNFHKKGHNGAIWIIIELEEVIMVLNNVTKFHKILIKSIRLRERTSLGQPYVRKYVRTDGQTGVTLNAPAIVMAGA